MTAVAGVAARCAAVHIKQTGAATGAKARTYCRAAAAISSAEADFRA